MPLTGMHAVGTRRVALASVVPVAAVTTPLTAFVSMTRPAAVCLGIKGLLLCGGQRGIQGFGGFAPAIRLCRALGPQGTHAIDALRRGE